MVEGENAVVDDKPCQHDNAEEIDEIELEALELEKSVLEEVNKNILL